MPLFSSKFSPRRTTPRKADTSLNKDADKVSDDLGSDIGPIKIKLGDQESLFDSGQWVAESGPASGTHKENKRLKKYVQELEDENNYLKLKFELLLDMVTQSKAESSLQEKEIEQLKNQISQKAKCQNKT